MGTNEFNGTEIAKKVFSSINVTHQKFGINYIASILVGSKSSKVQKYNHNKLPEHGGLKDYSFDQVKEFIRELIEQSYLEQTKGEYPIVRLLEKSALVLVGKEEVNLKLPDPNLAKKWSLEKGESIGKSLELFKQGKTIAEIAAERNLAQTTILSHLAIAYQQGEEIDIDQFVEDGKQEVITQAFKKLGTDYLSPVKQALGVAFSWEDLKLVRAKILRQHGAV